MDSFSKYYKEKFRNDIHHFFSSVPESSKHHDNIDDKTIFTIQLERLTKDFDHLQFLLPPDKLNFAVALFFTVLVDEVCYSYYRNHYSDFRALTLYPKFIGNCPGGCRYHLHPVNIFSAICYSRKLLAWS